MRKPIIGVMGGGNDASPQSVQWGSELGTLIARQNWILLTGGRNAGVMDSASKAAQAEGGLTLGILLGPDTEDASDGVDIAVVTNVGSARNNINVLTSNVVVACGSLSAGTLSEVALALKSKRPVILLTNDALDTEFLTRIGGELLTVVSTPAQVIERCRELLSPS